MKSRIFYAAKINIHGNIFSQDLENLIYNHIPRVLLESTTIKIHTWNWTFTDVEKINYNEQILITGNLTKSKHVNQKIRKGNKTSTVNSDDELAQTSFFVYDIKNEILAHEKTGSIDIVDFRNVFTDILGRDEYVGEVKIYPIPEPYKIREEISTMEKLTSLKFYLIHPNPGKKEFNLYQKIIKENSLKELDIGMENKDGFEITKTAVGTAAQDEPKFNSTVEAGIELVESGYGDIKVKGYNTYIKKGKKRIQ
ncbi:hypothetical protein P5G51_003870 [Virgibacillus sp. 179-BFC.A HS]|uniref:Uncharacterized protein n=1 Tax=Tigheibacillus jepli TaxID=3035914 RepID=A0ABU5CFN5_9BACI|nr:hypothetical protein [Virgibacillus sp. 179-BFC.A HS]MDY0404654.1 hypothetical protein [Virgibacillus sp. 179-BFC.A HS]